MSTVEGRLGTVEGRLKHCRGETEGIVEGRLSTVEGRLITVEERLNQSTNQHRNVLEITIVGVKKWLLLIYYFLSRNVILRFNKFRYKLQIIYLCNFLVLLQRILLTFVSCIVSLKCIKQSFKAAKFL